ncbi:hypothetical protein JCM16303_004458 [Sporobolomyces ruberrimus]
MRLAGPIFQSFPSPGSAAAVPSPTTSNSSPLATSQSRPSPRNVPSWTGLQIKAVLRASDSARIGDAGKNTTASEGGGRKLENTTVLSQDPSHGKRKSSRGISREGSEAASEPKAKKQRSNTLTSKSSLVLDLLSGDAEPGGARTSTTVLNNAQRAAAFHLHLVDSGSSLSGTVLTLFRRSGCYPPVGDHIDATTFQRQGFEEAFDNWFLRRSEYMGDESSPIPYDAKDQQQVELGVVAVVQAYVTWRLISSAHVASNRAEITRLRKQADSLARLLRLTAVEFELFRLEAKRLAEGAKGEPVRLPPLFLTSKRPRSSEGDDSADGPARNRRRLEEQPAYSREQHSSARLSLHQAPLRSPVPSIHGLPSTAPDHRPPGFRQPSIRPDTDAYESSSTLNGHVSVSSERRMVASSSTASSTLNLSSYAAQSQSSRSILPPLEIPAFAITRPPPSPSHVRRAPSVPTSSSLSYPRRPQYVLPTPNGLSTPVSGSSLLVSLTATSTTKSLASVGRPISLSLEPSRYDQVRTQPQTPRSAGIDSRDETEQENVGEKGQKGAEEEASRAIEMPKKLSSNLRNLLND